MLLLDKHTFPRDKICGDAIGGRVRNVLNQIDPALLNQLDQFTKKTASTGWKLISPGGNEIQVDFTVAGHVSRRMDFDNWLMERVKERNSISIEEGADIHSIEYGKNSVILRSKDGRIFETKLIVACDGAHSIVAKKFTGFVPSWKNYSGAVRAYYEGISGMQEGIIEIHLDNRFMPGYFWIFPLNQHEANVGFGMLSSDVRKKKIDLKIALDEIITQSPTLSRRFLNAKRSGEIRGFGLPLGGRNLPVSGERFMLCGDAASLIDPLNGEGIGNAMWSGWLAAKQVQTCFEENRFDQSFMK